MGDMTEGVGDVAFGQALERAAELGLVPIGL
jgi:hypothetical protein